MGTKRNTGRAKSAPKTTEQAAAQTAAQEAAPKPTRRKIGDPPIPGDCRIVQLKPGCPGEFHLRGGRTVTCGSPETGRNKTEWFPAKKLTDYLRQMETDGDIEIERFKG